MTQSKPYQANATNIDEVITSKGYMLLEFGTNWCGHCTTAQIVIAEALSAQPDLLHIKEEDGAGIRLGRNFRVKLWPTLILLKDGEEIDRVVRPTSPQKLLGLLSKLEE